MTAERNPPGPVLILSGGVGAGHTVVASAIVEELRQRGVFVTHVDTYALLSPPLRWAAAQLHTRFEEFVPALYGTLYTRALHSRGLSSLHQFVTFRGRYLLAKLFQRTRPSVVLVNHAYARTLAAPLAARFGFRLVMLPIDYFAHAFQVHPSVDLYCALHPLVARDLRAYGVGDDHIVHTGLPLRASFDALPEQTDARRSLGFPLGQPVILVTRGGMAAGRETVVLLEALLRAPGLQRCQVVAVLGRSRRGYRLVARAFRQHPRLRIERFVEAWTHYLAAANIVIGKAGSSSSTEVFVAGRPLVVYALQEGNETENMTRFTAADVALDGGRDPERAVALVEDLLAHPERARALVEAARRFVVPNGRQNVARVVQDMLGVRNAAFELKRAVAVGARSYEFPLDGG